MICATVSAQSCFCWPYRASPSLAAKNIISLILALTIWWCPCAESSLVLLEEGVCYDPCFLLTKLYFCPASFCTPRPNLPVISSYFCIPMPYDEDDIFFLVLVLEGLVGLHGTSQLQLLWYQRLGHRLGWFASEINWDHSVIFKIAPQYFISGSFVDSEGYSISSKGFLPILVDIMVIWVKFTHSSPF